MRIVRPANLEPWAKVGAPRVLAEAYHSVLKNQDFVDPRTGKTHEFTLSESPNWVSVGARTPDGSLLLVRQYKQGIDGIFYEFCAGVLDTAEEPPEAAARRELEEETGYVPQGITLLAGPTWVTPRRGTTRVYSLWAPSCAPTGVRHPDETEEIEVAEASVAEFWDLVARHEIRDVGTLVTAFHALRAGLLPLPSS